MIIVIDASAAIEIVLNGENADEFKKVLNESDLIIAPDTYPSEITNVFWKYAAFSHIEETKCSIGIDSCIDLVDDYLETRMFCREVFAESVKYNHPVYDLYYLIIARRQNALLLTKDKKMLKIAKAMKIKVS